MTLKDEVRDPWTYVMGALGGGLGWAVLAGMGPPGWIAGAGVGAAVAVTKIVAGAFVRPTGPRRKRPNERRLPVLTRTFEAAWLARAEAAQRNFDQIASSVEEGPVAERVQSLGDEACESLWAIQRLAGQASAIRVALGRMDPRRLAYEQDRLRADRSGDPVVVAERQRALGAVQAQLDAYQRLTSALTAVLARIESGSLGLEGLVARLAEVVALTQASAVGSGDLAQVDELAQELEGLRAGLVEAEDVSTRAMQGLAPLPQAAPATTQQPVPGSVPTQARRRAGE
ncbi:MAG TPA: hypothetical protein VFQ85_15175 [Mycobacteriales bacterium]|jgi:hypothetical protein|nr:hypothetical protein [Mycobacteriales bacterium]